MVFYLKGPLIDNLLLFCLFSFSDDYFFWFDFDSSVSGLPIKLIIKLGLLLSLAFT